MLGRAGWQVGVALGGAVVPLGFLPDCAETSAVR